MSETNNFCLTCSPSPPGPSPYLTALPLLPTSQVSTDARYLQGDSQPVGYVTTTLLHAKIISQLSHTRQVWLSITSSPQASGLSPRLNRETLKINPKFVWEMCDGRSCVSGTTLGRYPMIPGECITSLCTWSVPKAPANPIPGLFSNAAHQDPLINGPRQSDSLQVIGTTMRSAERRRGSSASSSGSGGVRYMTAPLPSGDQDSALFGAKMTRPSCFLVFFFHWVAGEMASQAAIKDARRT